METLLIFILLIEVVALGVMLVMIFKMAKIANLKMKEAESYFLQIRDTIEQKYGKFL